MESPDYDGAKLYVQQLLNDKLPDNLYYHGVHHTFDDVLPATVRLAEMTGVSDEDMLMLKTAAVYHDSGYITRYELNEPIGKEIAEDVLPDYGYTPEQIKLIGELIIATQLPREPQTLLERIICDADLDSLGREDFHIVSHSLRLEMSYHGQTFTIRDWYIHQVKFLKAHEYYTKAAQELRDAGKEQHIADIKELLGGVRP